MGAQGGLGSRAFRFGILGLGYGGCVSYTPKPWVLVDGFGCLVLHGFQRLW